MIVKFQSDKKECCIIDDVEKISNFRHSEETYVTVQNGEFITNNGSHLDLDYIFISNDLLNNHYNNKPEYHVPFCVIRKTNSDPITIAFVEGYIMNDDGKTIDRF